MNLTLSLLITLFSFTQTDAETPNIAYNPTDVTLQIGPLTLNEKLEVEEYIAILGEATKVKENRGAVDYIYENHGLVLAAKEGVVMGIGITFHTDGDEKFAQNPYAGKLTLGKTIIGMESVKKDLQSVEGLEIQCPGTLMCFSADREAPIKILAGFNEEDPAHITQIGFYML